MREIRDLDHERMARWKDVGLVPGAVVRMADVRAIDDVFELEVEGARLSIGSEGLEGVRIELERASAGDEAASPDRTAAFPGGEGRVRGAGATPRPPRPASGATRRGAAPARGAARPAPRDPGRRR